MDSLAELNRLSVLYGGADYFQNFSMQRSLLSELRRIDFGDNYNVLEIKRYDNNPIFYRLTAENVDSLIELLESGGRIEYDDNFSVSDQDVLATLRVFGDIEGYEFHTFERGDLRRGGAHYPFIVPFRGLERYGVYSENGNVENCLLQALYNAGVTNVYKIAEKLIRTDFVPTKSLEKIAKTLGITILVKTDSTRRILKYNEGCEKVVSLGLLYKHYFLREDTEFTQYSLKHYDEVKHKKDWNYFIKKDERDKRRVSDSYTLLRIIPNCNFAKPRKYVDFRDSYKELKGCQIEDLYKEQKPEESHFGGGGIIDERVEEIESEEPKEKCHLESSQLKLYFFDTEAHVEDTKHGLTTISLSKENGRPYIFPNTHKALDYIVKIRSQEDKVAVYHPIVYAHNLRYDIGFIADTKGYQMLGGVRKNTRVMSQYGMYYGTPILFRDSYSMIPMKLADFGSAFGLDQCKEVVPYSQFTKEHLKFGKPASIRMALKEFEKNCKTHYYFDEKEYNNLKEQFLKNIDEWNCRISNTKYDLKKYHKIYCNKDTEVLQKGVNKFRAFIKELCGLDIAKFISLPQLTMEYYQQQGAYEGCNMICPSIVQYWIERAAVGGRVMVRENKKLHVKGKIHDFDAVGLYASAVVNTGGVPLGGPTLIPKENWNMEFLNTCTHYIVEINITKVGKEYPFPLLSRLEDDSRHWTNNLIGRHTVGKVCLEDLIEFQQIEFEILGGLYWCKGLNPVAAELTKKLTDLRKEYKKSGNPLQSVLKLLVNSFYGKNGQKPVEETEEFVNTSYSKNGTKENIDKYLKQNMYKIKSYYKHNETWVVNQVNEIGEKGNYIHYSVSILDHAKRIMNQVMCLAHDLGIRIFYTDTDSMQIEDRLDELSAAFKEKYGRELIGKDLGQFHTDFEDINGKPSWGIEGWYIDKKVYCVKLTNEDGDIRYHVRCKGIPGKCIKTPVEDFEKFFRGEEVVYNLSENSACFDAIGYGTITNKKDFTRRVGSNFTNPAETIEL